MESMEIERNMDFLLSIDESLKFLNNNNKIRLLEGYQEYFTSVLYIILF